MNEQAAKAARLELDRGRQALKAARVLDEAGLRDDALSRLYYALFHALTAVLLTRGIEPKRHRAMVRLVGAHLSDLFGANEVAVIARIQSYRDLADSDRTWFATPEITATAFAEVEPLLSKAEAHLEGE